MTIHELLKIGDKTKELFVQFASAERAKEIFGITFHDYILFQSENDPNFFAWFFDQTEQQPSDEQIDQWTAYIACMSLIE